MANKINTPFYDHISDYPSVYEPSEDTFLLTDTLEQELSFIKELKPTFVAEIGSGSGLNIVALSSILKNSSHLIATDINIEACKATAETAKKNFENVEVLNMNFLDFFHHKFDLIIFNPPYVVTENCELDGLGLSRSWAGGSNNGRVIIDAFLERLPNILSKNGCLYLLTIKENEPKKICEELSQSKIFTASIINERKIRGEHLFILKILKN